MKLTRKFTKIDKTWSQNWALIPTNTNPIKKLTKPEIKTSPKDRLDSILGRNRDLLLIAKQEPWYKDDVTINYGILIDKSNGKRHGKFNKLNVLQDWRKFEWIFSKGWFNFIKFAEKLLTCL